MIPQAFAIPPAYSSTLLYIITGFGILLLIFICIVAFSVMLSLIIVALVHVICEYFWKPLYERGQHDTEAAGERVEDQPEVIRQDDQVYQVRNNMQILEMLERIIRDIGDRRGQTQLQYDRIRLALKKMPPRIYITHEQKSSFSEECSICLESFEAGDSCRVFPVCGHIFHSSCISIWLKTNLTCPICRNCILDR